jgi:hypothetical protein
VEKRVIDQKRVAEDQLIGGALLGVNIVAAFQILLTPNVDRSLVISLYCFTIGIPLTAANSIILMVVARCTYAPKKRWYNRVIALTSAACPIVGVTAALWHFSVILALMFLCLCALGFWAIIENVNRLQDVNLK